VDTSEARNRAGTEEAAPNVAGARERRREQRGWYFYDWANSVFSASVITVFLGPYLTTVAKAAADADGYVHPWAYRSAPGRTRSPPPCCCPSS
jgi:UMF1 family MFS transporter